jgi:hypothetical protein
MPEKAARPAALGGANRAGETEGYDHVFKTPTTNPVDQVQYVPRNLKGVPVWVWNRDGPEKAIAEIVVGRWVVQTYIRWCPHCSGEHWHGGCALDNGDPRHAFTVHDGWNGPHCAEQTDTYRLVWSGAPAVFFPGDSRHPAARAAMKRLKRLGLPTSNKTLKLRRRR